MPKSPSPQLKTAEELRLDEAREKGGAPSPGYFWVVNGCAASPDWRPMAEPSVSRVRSAYDGHNRHHKWSCRCRLCAPPRSGSGTNFSPSATRPYLPRVGSAPDLGLANGRR